MNRDENIKELQKFYMMARETSKFLALLQNKSETLGINPKTMPLYEINIALRKYHDLARDMERDLDEKQQDHFVARENKLLVEEN